MLMPLQNSHPIRVRLGLGLGLVLMPLQKRHRHTSPPLHGSSMLSSPEVQQMHNTRATQGAEDPPDDYEEMRPRQ